MLVSKLKVGPISLRHRFELGVGLVILLSLLFSLANWSGFRSMVDQNRHAEDTASVIRAHQLADMMHDAIRSDILTARIAMLEQDGDAITAAQESLADSFSILRETQEKIAAVPLDGSAAKEMAKLRTAWVSYVTRSEQAMAAIVGRSPRTEEIMAAFTREADQVETVMGDGTDFLTARMAEENEHVAEVARNAEILLAVQPLMLSLLLVLAAWLARRTLIIPLSQSAQSLFRLSQGDEKVEVVGTERSDEIGDLARGIAAFKAKADEVSAALAAQKAAEAQARAAGDRASRESDRREALVRLAVGLETRVLSAAETVASTARQLQDASQAVEAAARNTRGELTRASATGSQIVGNVDEVAVATQQLATSAQEIGRLMADAVGQIDEAAQLGTQAADQTNQLSDLAAGIDTISTFIADIARQTNLLALNAAIEAARAGAAGKGFAVVADEVKALATEAGDAADKIASQISAVRQLATNVAGAFSQVNGAVERMHHTSVAVASSVEEQGLATLAIDTSVQEVALGARGLGQNMQSVDTIAENVDEQARSLVAVARDLDRLSSALASDVSQMIAEVRAA